MSSSHSERRMLPTEKQWRPSSIPAATCCSIKAMVVAFLCTKFARASHRSQMECRILQSRSPQSSLPTPVSPKHFVSRSGPRSSCRQQGEASGISPTSSGEEANLSISPPASSDGGIEDAIAN